MEVKAKKELSNVFIRNRIDGPWRFAEYISSLN